ncbi:hypothetical protein PLICRDRAFT_156202 [Plicaturopsis crispa FD-325 SS-3]|nr:hypothetical protein PLICRDRAFT_156202 [Plicaturopsis crispa FD-325 SS-3]
MPPAQLTHELFTESRTEGMDVQLFRPELLTKKAVGQVFKFPVKSTAPFRRFGVPRNIVVEHRLLSQPCCVVRDVTVSASDILDQAKTKPSSQTRRIITGIPGSGKSTLLLQSVEYCVAKGWVVLYIPRAISLVDATQPFSYDPRTQTYVQPRFSQQTLKRFLDVNASALNSLKTTTDILLDRRPTVPAGTSLAELIGVGIRDLAIAPVILSAALEELGKQTSHPVLVAVDDVQALYQTSRYRDPQYNFVKSYHLSLPRLLLEYASGKKTFQRGAFFGAISTTNTTFPLPLELREAVGIPYDRPTGPYAKRSPEFTEYAQGVKGLAVPDSLSLAEAASLFEVWKTDNALSVLPNDETFLAKYSESSGVARDFVWKGMLSSFAT